MTQAIGASAQISYVEETTYGTTPGSPSMKLLKAATYGASLSANIEELRSNSINANRSVESARGGNIAVTGSIPFELPALGLGTILKHVLGSNVTTGAGPTYTHTIKRGSLPVGLTIEKGFTDISQYMVHTGCRFNSMALSLSPQGLVTGSLEVVGQDETASGSSLGSPSSVAHDPFAHHEATVLEGGGAADILGFEASLTNNLDTAGYVVGSRNINTLPAGKGDATGTVTFLFEDLVKYNKWLNETETSLKVTYSDGSNSIELFWPKVKFFGAGSPAIETDQGIVLTMDFRAVYDSSEATDLKITIVNTEATI